MGCDGGGSRGLRRSTDCGCGFCVRSATPLRATGFYCAETVREREYRSDVVAVEQTGASSKPRPPLIRVFRQSDTVIAAVFGTSGPTPKPRNRANRHWRWRAYHPCRIRSRVRLALVASIVIRSLLHQYTTARRDCFARPRFSGCAPLGRPGEPGPATFERPARALAARPFRAAEAIALQEIYLSRGEIGHGRAEIAKNRPPTRDPAPDAGPWRRLAKGRRRR